MTERAVIPRDQTETTQERIGRIGRELIQWWTPLKMGIVSLLSALLITALEYLNKRGSFYLPETLRQIVVAFDNSATIELISLATTVLIVNRLYQHREMDREKRRLILQMGSPDNAFAREAVRALRSRGWLQDGSLKGADLPLANLQGANLLGANLQGARFFVAKFQGAWLAGANLQGASLWGAHLQETILLDANLQGAILVRANLRGAQYNNATTWPEGFTPPPDAINVDAEANVED